MPFLFIILGQKLGLDVTASTAPEHVFVKYRDDMGNILKCWPAFVRYANTGHLPIDNNPVENCIRPISLGKNYAQSVIMLSIYRKSAAHNTYCATDCA